MAEVVVAVLICLSCLELNSLVQLQQRAVHPGRRRGHAGVNPEQGRGWLVDVLSVLVLAVPGSPLCVQFNVCFMSEEKAQRHPSREALQVSSFGQLVAWGKADRLCPCSVFFFRCDCS